MKAETLSELRRELAGVSPGKILDICLRLAKFKKENKELITYLLFEADDEEGYIRKVKSEIDSLVEGINRSNIYYIKKSLRKTLRVTNKYIRYSGKKTTEADLLIYFCRKYKALKIPSGKSVALSNLYSNQIRKIQKAVMTMHEDLQYDYRKELEELE
jgi:hypothetical protein